MLVDHELETLQVQRGERGRSAGPGGLPEFGEQDALVNPLIRPGGSNGSLEERAALEDIVPGERLAVFGRFEGDGPRQLIAQRLLLLPPPKKQP